MMRIRPGVALVPLLGLTAVCWGQPNPEFLVREATLAKEGGLVVLGSGLGGRSPGDTQGIDYSKILTGGYGGRTFEIDCLPFLVEETDDVPYRYWAFPTDDTGFGWDESHPIILVSDKAIALSESTDRIRALGTWVPDAGGWIPQFRVLTGYAHPVRE